MNWLDICVFDEINLLGLCVVVGLKGDIVIFCVVDDQVFVFDDCCLYKGGLLFQGLIYGK